MTLITSLYTEAIVIAGNFESLKKSERFVENGYELGMKKRGQWLLCMRWKREKMCCRECWAIDLAIYLLPLSLRYTTLLHPHTLTHKINKQKPKFPPLYFAIWWSSAKMHLQTYFVGEYSLVCCLVCCGAVFLWAIRSVGNRPASMDGKSFKILCNTCFFQEQKHHFLVTAKVCPCTNTTLIKTHWALTFHNGAGTATVLWRRSRTAHNKLACCSK